MSKTHYNEAFKNIHQLTKTSKLYRFEEKNQFKDTLLQLNTEIT